MHPHGVHTLVVDLRGPVMFTHLVRLRLRRDDSKWFALHFFLPPPKDAFGAIAPHYDAVFKIQSNDG